MAAHDATVWRPGDILRPPDGVDVDLSVVMLNHFEGAVGSWSPVWNRGRTRICVDGGANVFFKYSRLHPGVLEPMTVVSGDFDSVSEDTMALCVSAGVRVVATPDQDKTDFTKALELAVEEGGRRGIVTLASTGGRFDHVFGIVNSLFVALELTDAPVYVFSGESVTWLMRKGRHEVVTPGELVGTTCGLVPIGQRAEHVTTQGLKWNMDDQSMAFGGVVSTSNAVAGSSVVVETDQPLLWTMAV